MSDYHWEEEALGKAYDSRLMKRLINYLKPYKGLFGLGLLFALMVSAFDLSLPFLTKTAIDQNVILPYRVLETQQINPSDIAAPIHINDQLALININKEESGQRQIWEANGWLSNESYLVVAQDAKPEILELVSQHRDVFLQASSGAFYAAEQSLSQLTLAQRTLLRQDDLAQVGTLALIFLGLLAMRFVSSFSQVYVLQYTGQNVMYDMRREIFGHMLKLPVRFFDKNPVGRLVTRGTNDVSAINDMFTDVLVNLIRDVFLIVGIVSIMFVLNWQLTSMILVVAPILLVLTFVFKSFARKAYREVRKRIAMLNAFLAENISGMRIIHLFAQEINNFKKFEEINDAKYNAEMRQTITFAIFNPIIHVMSSIAIALIIWYGGGQVVQSTLTLGALIAFLSYVRMLFQPINDLSEKFNILQGAMASSERIFMLLEEEEEDRGKAQTPEPILGRIEFKDVWFAYNDEDWVLRGVSFAVEPGHTMAIVGATGSGKTTIISLLQRLYDIQKGQILLDGVDIREYDLDHLRVQMAVVLQDVFLFSGDIAGNIQLQSEEISQEKVKDAARFVSADKFIEQLDNQYEAEVTERGSTLSAGQRQLLAFARAIAFDPKVLILDEATANIDSQTEQIIQSSLKKILQGRTSIVIAHRLSTIRDANQILVLDQGQLAEQGSHEELIAHGGLYAALYKLQFAELGVRQTASD